MTVLLVIAALIVLGFVVWFINYSNAYSWRRYRYRVFSVEDFGIYVVAYALILFGFIWYDKTLHHSGDTLNGTLLMIIGAIILIALFLDTIEKTSIVYGSGMGMIKLTLYAIATPLVIAIIVMMAIWVMDTKPVIRLDD